MLTNGTGHGASRRSGTGKGVASDLPVRCRPRGRGCRARRPPGVRARTHGALRASPSTPVHAHGCRGSNPGARPGNRSRPTLGALRWSIALLRGTRPFAQGESSGCCRRHSRSACRPLRRCPTSTRSGIRLGRVPLRPLPDGRLSGALVPPGSAYLVGFDRGEEPRGLGLGRERRVGRPEFAVERSVPRLPSPKGEPSHGSEVVVVRLPSVHLRPQTDADRARAPERDVHLWTARGSRREMRSTRGERTGGGTSRPLRNRPTVCAPSGGQPHKPLLAVGSRGRSSGLCCRCSWWLARCCWVRRVSAEARSGPVRRDVASRQSVGRARRRACCPRRAETGGWRGCRG